MFVRNFNNKKWQQTVIEERGFLLAILEGIVPDESMRLAMDRGLLKKFNKTLENLGVDEAREYLMDLNNTIINIRKHSK